MLSFSLGMNKKWRDALLTAARNLRQNVLKGRIWGGADGSPATSPSPQSASPPKLFSNPELNSSSSSIESSASLSGEDDSSQSGAALGRSKARRYRNGRVRGMIESFERSGSFSSDGGFEDGEGPAEERVNLRRWARQEAQLTGQRVLESPSPSRRRPLPVPPSPSGSHSSRLVADEEPTVEALLAEMAREQPMTGARAWEEMDLAPGVTVKRVPEMQAPVPIRLEAVPETIGHKTVTGLGSGRSSGGSSKGKNERRVVTAIFAPSSSTPGSPSKGALRPLEATDGLEAFADAPIPVPSPERQEKSRPLPPTPAEEEEQEKVVVEPVQAPQDPEALFVERMLEEEIMATRALLDTFRARLEVVEQKVADLEEKEAARERLEEALAKKVDATARMETETETVTRVASVEIGVQSAAVVVEVDAQAQVQSDALVPVSGVGSKVEEPCSTSPALTRSHPPVGPKGTSSASPLSSSSSSAAAAGALAAAASSTGLQSVIPEVVRRLHAPASTLFGTRDVLDERDEGDEAGKQPANVSDLPSYVFLVGLGVCAVVIQVVLRKVVGKGSGFRP